MSGPSQKTSVFFYVPVILLTAWLLAWIFAHNFGEGMLVGKNTPPPAEGKKVKAEVDLRALAKDAGSAAKGKTLFMTNCASCHGTTGKGDGDRAASLNPKPRNYTNEKFKFGDDIHSIYETLQKGSPGTSMPSFGLLPKDEVMAMAHYVRTLVPAPTASTDDIINKFPEVKADASAPVAAATTMVADTNKRIPISLAMLSLAQPVAKAAGVRKVDVNSPGGHLYTQKCATCHGSYGEGAKWKTLAVSPYRYEFTAGLLTPQAPWFNDRKQFGEIVTTGLPGDLMPGHGTFSAHELDELHSFVRSLSPAP
jgi:mono/diheme cytochrome c family protein